MAGEPSSKSISPARVRWDELFAKPRPYGSTEGPPQISEALSDDQVDELEARLELVLKAKPYEVAVRVTEGSPVNVGQFHARAVEMAVGLVAKIRTLQARVAQLEGAEDVE